MSWKTLAYLFEKQGQMRLEFWVSELVSDWQELKAETLPHQKKKKTWDNVTHLSSETINNGVTSR